MKKTILTLSLAAIAFAFAAPDVQAVPTNKVPGIGKKEQSRAAGSPSKRDDGRKSYWQKKIGI